MADEQKPAQSVIDAIKAEFPDRRVKRVAFAVDSSDGDELVFVMTSPKREEWRKYRREITAAKDDIEKLETAIETAALAMIRWPERAEVRVLFDLHPGIIQSFAEELSKLAGAHAEVTTKNA